MGAAILFCDFYNRIYFQTNNKNTCCLSKKLALFSTGTMTHALVTFPWVDRQELRHVYNELYSDNVTLQMHAIGRVQIWEARSLSRLPMAVECTAAFIKANIEYSNCPQPVGNNHRLREIYSMALIRFVNLFTERNQMKAHALPVHLVAQYMGVPNWIVDLRHDATHAAFPSLGELRAASQWSLEWLKSEFWEVQSQDTTKASDIKSCLHGTLRDLLVAFMQARYQNLVEDLPAASKATLTKLEEVVTDMGVEACPVLLDDGYLIPTEEQLNSMGIEIQNAFNERELHVPTKIIQIWRPVIFLLQRCDLIPSLLFEILSNIGTSKSVRYSLLAKLFYTIIDSCSRRKKNKTKVLVLSCDIPFKSLLEKCLMLENSVMGPSVVVLVQNSGLGVQEKSQLKELYSYCILGTRENLVDMYDDEEVACEIAGDTIPNNSVWHKSSAKNEWCRIPFGQLPEEPVSYSSLELGPFRDSGFPNFDTGIVSDMTALADVEDSMDENSSIDSLDEQYEQNEQSYRVNLWNVNDMDHINSSIEL